MRLSACVLAACAVPAEPAIGQTVVPIPPAAVRPVPGVDPMRTTVHQLSRDGRRARITIASADGTEQQAVVVDLQTGTALLSRPSVPASPVTTTTDVLSPDGSVLTYLESINGTTLVQQRHIDSGVVTERLRTSNSFQLGATSDAGSAIAFVENGVVTVDTGGLRRTFADACPVIPDGKVTMGGSPLELSGSGEVLRYDRGYWSGHRPGAGPYGVDVLAAEVNTGVATCLDMRHPSIGDAHQAFGYKSTLAGNGRYLGATGLANAAGGSSFHAMLVDTRTAEAIQLAPDSATSSLLDVSDDARHVLLSRQVPLGVPGQLVVLDRQTGILTSLKAADVNVQVTLAQLSGDGRTVLFRLVQTTPTATEVHLRIADLDGDGDGQHDTWEAAFGLNRSDPADALLDPDADGLTNAQEFAAGGHPHGTPVRYFAEGASGRFFDTSLALFNPAATSATVNVRFLGPDGATAAWPLMLPAESPAYLDTSSIGLPFTEFSIVVESATSVVAERRMVWDRATGYGTHAGNGVAAPSTQWYFAEGATIAGIQTFLLLQNPGPTAASVTTRYLLANGTAQERQHVVPASSRLTVWVNQEGAPLDAAEFAMTVVADAPIVAERATYRDAVGQVFGAGSVTAGVAAPAQTWIFAEGATGSYFDTFLLLANSGSTPATVKVDYLRAGTNDVLLGLPLSRSHVVAPGQRLTVWADQEAPTLADVAVSARVTSDVPIVAERAMWWPGPTAATWHGTHVGTGNATPGLMWAIAGAEVDPATDTDTFVTVAHLSLGIAQLRVTAHLADGRHITREFSASNRHTLWPRYDFPETVGQRFALTIESLEVYLAPGPSRTRGRVPLTVETVLYRGSFAAGDVSQATRLPDPIDEP